LSSSLRRTCLHPDHLFLGDQQANVDDMWAKGRGIDPPTFVGSEHFRTSLTETDVEKIRQRVEEGKSYGLVASEFGIARHVVYGIAFGKSWSHVGGSIQTRQKRPKQSRFTGVRITGRLKDRWEAFGRINGDHVYLGTFTSEEDAARARNEWDVANGRPPSNWLTPLVIEEITMAQWEEMQRGPGEWVPVLNEMPDECHHD
jgi:hypothetical protein